MKEERERMISLKLLEIYMEALNKFDDIPQLEKDEANKAAKNIENFLKVSHSK